MIKVAAIDLDDTLLCNDGTVTLRTLQTLRAWRAQGNHIIIATGRPRRTVGTVLPLELQDAPLISYNGAEIHINGEKIYDNLISAAATLEIVTRLLDAVPHAEIGLEIDNVLYLNRPSTRARLHTVANLLEIATQPAAKVLVFGDELSGVEAITTSLPPGAQALYSSRYRFLQILAQNVDKAEALRFLLPQWGLTPEQMVAFGDDTNDVEMVRISGLGVAMSNAVPEVLAVADRITTTNEEDGVAIVLEELLGM
ncbi:MAG: HAD family hydrolase [Chloroflexi bacterium]|nr:HAD family hydrolase [Chloroflexota bacterium]